MKGIDVSTYQGNIDWKKVRASGVEFAIIKATQGRSVTSSLYLFTDSKFKANITSAPSEGISCGVYHYLTAKTTSEALTESKYFIDAITPYKKNITLYAAVDVEEDKYLPTDKALLTSIVHTFCDCVKSAGFTPIVYTNPNYLNNRLNDITKWDLWLALWRDKSNVPTGYPNMKIWQHSSTETVDGITGKIDGNLGYFTAPEPTSPEYDKLVCEKCGLEEQTRTYLNSYKYASDLWRKLWNAMK